MSEKSETEKKAIKEKIEKLKQEKENAKGTQTEVFSRVCGYLRPVQNWNKGKQAEYALRAKFKMNSCGCE